MTQIPNVGSTIPSWADLKESVLSLFALANHQMSAYSRNAVYRPAELEHLSLELLQIAHGISLGNANCFKTNAEAIDLKSADGSLGIQITLKVDLAKVRKTVEIYRRESVPGGELDGMQKLWILGLGKPTEGAKKHISAMPDVLVETLEKQLHLDNLNCNELEEMQTHLRVVTRTVPNNMPSLKKSLERFVDFLNRPAITDSASAIHEDWSKCVSALENAIYLAHSGIWVEPNKPPVENWVLPLGDLPNSIKVELRRILRQITELRNAIEAWNPSHMTLSGHPASLVDIERAKLMLLVNAFCRNHAMSPPFIEATIN